MTANPYQVWGASTPPMLGRASLVRQVEDHWLRVEIPRHVSVVGPAYYGKSVLLRHLADVHRTGSVCYVTTAYVDLRDGTPESDGAFMERLADAVKEALRPIHPAAEWLDIEDVSIHERLDVVFKGLEEDGKRLLVVLDGFDDALAQTELTPKLWSQLRSMAERPSLRLLTGSRRPLRELCRTGETRASPLWNIFYHEPVRVHAIDESDWPAFLQPLRETGCEFEEPARKEIANWTGGIPVLVCALLQRVWEEHRGARLTKPIVDQSAERLLRDPDGLLGPLWEDCDRALRSDLGSLSETDVSLTDLPTDRRDALVSRGFGHISRNSVRGCCRLMQRYAQAQAPEMADLNRTFGSRAGFDRHIRSLLELRLAQVAAIGADEELCRLVRNAIERIKPPPKDALREARFIVEHALNLVWEMEFPDGKIPQGLLSERAREQRYHSDGSDRALPLSERCHVMRQLTRSDRPVRSKYVTKRTSLLMDHLQSVGNFGSHLGDYPDVEVTIGFAASIVLSAVELVECLAGEVARPERSAEADGVKQ